MFPKRNVYFIWARILNKKVNGSQKDMHGKKDENKLFKDGQNI